MKFRAVLTMVMTIVMNAVTRSSCAHWKCSSFVAGEECVTGSLGGAKLRALVTMGSTALVSGGCVCSAPLRRRREAIVCQKGAELRS